ncbi:MAG: hypothetical protein F4X65_10890 [Chloroflexi bacterium]|nr:hypothetical protein [Chloroflexota bacterium]
MSGERKPPEGLYPEKSGRVRVVADTRRRYRLREAVYEDETPRADGSVRHPEPNPVRVARQLGGLGDGSDANGAVRMAVAGCAA